MGDRHLGDIRRAAYLGCISMRSRRDLGAISRLVEECRQVGRMYTLMIKRNERRAIGTRGRRWAVERQPGDLG